MKKFLRIIYSKIPLKKYLFYILRNNFKIRENALDEANNIITYKISQFKKWLNANQSNDLIKTYRGYIDDITHGAVIKAKKLDVNNDGFISLDELTNRQNRRFQDLDHNDDGRIDETEFNARLLAMFNRVDSNSDGMLDDVEILKQSHRHNGKSHNTRGLHKKWL